MQRELGQYSHKLFVVFQSNVPIIHINNSLSKIYTDVSSLSLNRHIEIDNIIVPLN